MSDETRAAKGEPKGDTGECHFLKRNSLAPKDLRAEYGLSVYYNAHICINKS